MITRTHLNDAGELVTEEISLEDFHLGAKPLFDPRRPDKHLVQLLEANLEPLQKQLALVTEALAGLQRAGQRPEAGRVAQWYSLQREIHQLCADFGKAIVERSMIMGREG